MTDKEQGALPHLPCAVGYRHKMDNTEGFKENTAWVVFKLSKDNPFGTPGIDYSASYPVTTDALFTADQMKEYARAALKAQPAIDASTSGMALDALMEARQFIPYNKYAQIKVDSAIAVLKAQPAPTEAHGEVDWPSIVKEKDRQIVEAGKTMNELRCKLAAQGEDSARLDALHDQMVDTIYMDDGRVIDVGGKQLNDLRKAIDEFLARASAETGGVKS